MKENTLYVERFRPTELQHYVGNENVKDTIQKYLDQGDIQNFIFYGPAGTGKTTLAKIIVKNLDCDYLYINASDENGIDTIREKVKGFASAASWKGIKVVILDEATAHLDSENESAVQQALEAALASRTSIVIAHRLSTIRKADLLLVLAQGRVVQRGNHEELVAIPGLYRDLYERQFSDTDN